MPARRFLALAGERALGLDTAQAEARLARALELTPADDPERPELLVRWADAAYQAGRPREAAAALDEALDLFRARGETEADRAGADPAPLPRRPEPRRGPTRSRSPPRRSTCSSRSRPARRSSPPTRSSPTRTSSRAPMARRSRPQTVRARSPRRSACPSRPARSAYRGNARAYLGDPDGLAEMERALALLIEQGAGHEAAISAEQPRDRPLPAPGAGPLARRLRAGDRLLRAARPGRALRRRIEADCPGLLVELGRPEEALERAGALAAAARGERRNLVAYVVRALELATHLARGEAEARPSIADWLVETARTQAAPDVTVEVLAAGRRRPARRRRTGAGTRATRRDRADAGRP